MIKENTTKRLNKAFSDALAAKASPCDDWVSVGRGFIEDAINHIDWLEHGISEWRDDAITSRRQAESARATARVAISHLNKVLNDCRTASEQQTADTMARDWLVSIGN